MNTACFWWSVFTKTGHTRPDRLVVSKNASRTLTKAIKSFSFGSLKFEHRPRAGVALSESDVCEDRHLHEPDISNVTAVKGDFSRWPHIFGIKAIERSYLQQGFKRSKVKHGGGEYFYYASYMYKSPLTARWSGPIQTRVSLQ